MADNLSLSATLREGWKRAAREAGEMTLFLALFMGDQRTFKY